MPLAADLPAQTQPVPRPAQVLYVSLELSPSKWLVTSLLSGTGRMSKHRKRRLTGTLRAG